MIRENRLALGRHWSGRITIGFIDKKNYTNIMLTHTF